MQLQVTAVAPSTDEKTYAIVGQRGTAKTGYRPWVKVLDTAGKTIGTWSNTSAKSTHHGDRFGGVVTVAGGWWAVGQHDNGDSTLQAFAQKLDASGKGAAIVKLATAAHADFRGILVLADGTIAATGTATAASGNMPRIARFDPAKAKLLTDLPLKIAPSGYEVFRPALAVGGDLLLPIAQHKGTKDGDADGVEVRADLAGATNCN